MTFRTALLIVLCLTAASAAAQTPPLLVVLEPTGEMQGHLPVYRRHPQGPVLVDVLVRGFSGRLLRLYAMEQAYLQKRNGTRPEPAYLLMSNRQGGFPEFGFVLDGEPKPGVGYVDLPKSQRTVGRFGAVDQIFPHELLHVIVRQLAGEPRESGANQVHAVGVRTDPTQAFSEGFAEHAQIMAVDDPDAARETRALVEDAGARERAQAEVRAFARDLAAAWPLPSPSRLRFILWFSPAEQVQRYWDVKANAFARTTGIPPSLLAASDKYGAYLYRSIVPGTSTAAPKRASEMLATEGVVSHLFWRMVTNDALGARVRDEAFYDQFGTRPDRVSPIDNVYLKLFHALAAGRPSDTAGLLRAYIREFPDEAPAVQAVVDAALLGQTLPDAPEIWLANDAFRTGTSLFDQFRGIPRTHTFDANAASVFDWMTVPGVTPDLAARLAAGAPYASLDALAATGGDSALAGWVRAMGTAMQSVIARAHSEEESLSLSAIAGPYLWRLAGLVGFAAVAGGWLARRTGVRRWWTAGLIALAATLIVLTLSWVVTSAWWMPVAAPLVLGGLPASLWRLARRKGARQAVAVFAGWAAAMVPAVLVSRAWF